MRVNYQTRCVEVDPFSTAETIKHAFHISKKLNFKMEYVI